MDPLPLLLASTRVIGWALVHFLWQAGLVGLIYRLIREVLPRGEVRYRAGMTALIVLAVCPLLTVWRLVQSAAPAIKAMPDLAVSALAGAGGASEITWNSGLDSFLPWMVLAWSCGVLLLSLRAWKQWRALKALVRAAETLPRWQGAVDTMAKRFGLRRRVTVLCSEAVVTPALLGWLRPVILLPVAVAFNFPAAQIELIFAHELAHLRRWDPLANLFQLVLETLHFYHPAVYWISSDVRNEREICCDAMALTINGGSRREFVAALAELGDLSEPHGGSLMLAASGGVLLDRVQQMIDPHSQPRVARSAFSGRFVAMLLGAMLIAVTLKLEGNQIQFQRNLTESFRALRIAMAPQWIPRLQSSKSARWADLVPTRVEVAHPLAMSPMVDAEREGSVLPIIAGRNLMSLKLSPGSLAIHDLVRSVNQLNVHLGVSDQAVAANSRRAPEPVLIRQPVYPQEAMTRGIEGSVTIEFNVVADGSVRDMHVVSAAPMGVFDQAALQALRGWKYAKALEASSPRRYRQTLAFSLDRAHSKRIASAFSSSDQIQAQLDCHVSTGTHICRLPENNESAALGQARGNSANH